MRETRRPIMPEPIKRAAIYRNMKKNGGRLICAETGDELSEADILNRRIHVDHRPSLALRYRNEFGGYEPAANDLDHLDVVSAHGHIFRTAKRRGLFRGDQTEIAHSRAMRRKQAEHEAVMAAKARGEPKPRDPFKRKIKSRPVPGSKASGWKKPVRGPAVRRS